MIEFVFFFKMSKDLGKLKLFFPEKSSFLIYVLPCPGGGS